MRHYLSPLLGFILALGVFTSTAAEPPASKPLLAPEVAATISERAEALRGSLIEQRRDFHMHPELSNREERTARIVAERLRTLGLEQVKTGIARHGVTAVLRGTKPGPVVAVRADMDALPIQETLNVPYVSLNPGVKHACGHDVHTTIQLGVAEVLSQMRKRFSGSIKFIFQPAEEGPPPGEEGGASIMIKEGALENPRPSAIFGLHTIPSFEVGQVAYHSGPSMASSDRFSLTVKGKKSHGAQPHLGIDAMVVAAECITALQTIRSRKLDPMEPLVLSIGTIQGGNRFNILAEEVKMQGTMRTHQEEVRKQVQAWMREIVSHVVAAHEASYELTFDHPNPVTYNDPSLVQATLPAMARALGVTNLFTPKPFMPSEDFSYYQREIPGFFYFLGVGNREKGITAGWHTPDYDVDEGCLVVGVNLMAQVLLEYLARPIEAK